MQTIAVSVMHCVLLAGVWMTYLALVLAFLILLWRYRPAARISSKSKTEQSP